MMPSRQDPRLTSVAEAQRAFCLELNISKSLLLPLPAQCLLVIDTGACPCACQHQVRPSTPGSVPDRKVSHYTTSLWTRGSHRRLVCCTNFLLAFTQ